MPAHVLASPVDICILPLKPSRPGYHMAVKAGVTLRLPRALSPGHPGPWWARGLLRAGGSTSARKPPSLSECSPLGVGSRAGSGPPTTLVGYWRPGADSGSARNVPLHGRNSRRSPHFGHARGAMMALRAIVYSLSYQHANTGRVIPKSLRSSGSPLPGCWNPCPNEGKYSSLISSLEENTFLKKRKYSSEEGSDQGISNFLVPLGWYLRYF